MNLNYLLLLAVFIFLPNAVQAQDSLTVASSERLIFSPTINKNNDEVPALRILGGGRTDTIYSEYDGDFVKEFSFLFENDVVFGVDEDYTTGLALEWKTKYVSIPGFLGFRERPFYRKNKRIENSPQDYVRNHSTFSIGTFFYTPSNLNSTTIDFTDRPYASFQYSSIGRISDRRKISKDGYHNSYVRFESELQLGLVGGPLAKNLQTWIHQKITRSTLPKGWDNQIGGTNNRLIFNYRLQYEVLWFRSMIREKKRRRSYYGYHRYNLYQPFNTVGFVYGNIGNIRGDFALGLKINLFNFNRTQDYSLNFFDGGMENFPSGSAPLLRYNRDQFSEHARQYAAPPCKDCNLFAKSIDIKNLVKELKIDRAYVENQDSFLVFLYQGHKRECNIELIKNAERRILELEHEIDSLKHFGNRYQYRIGQLEKTQINILELHRYISRRKSRDYSALLDTSAKYYARDWSFNFFVEPQFRWVRFNGMLQGVLFDDNSPYTIPVINPFVGEVRAGVNIRGGGFQFQLGYAGRTREYRQDPFAINKALKDGKPWHNWFYFRLIILPNFIADAHNRRFLVHRKMRRNRRRIKRMK